jgi:hypothetical protein
MSGITGSKLNIRGSGRIAKLGTDGQALTSAGAGMAAAFEDLAGGVSWQTIETGSTMTAVAGNGYWVDTTSNACTITLPASASVGDTIIFTDYARNWGTNGITIDPNGLNYQSRDDTFTIEYGTDGMSLAITYMNATQGWVPTIDEAVTDVPYKGNSEGIFAFGKDASDYTAVSNLVSNTGVVATDVTGVGTGRLYLKACEYGDDKGIMAYGSTASFQNVSNLVSNAGVVASDTAGVGTARGYIGACSYGGDKGIFGFGHTGSYTGVTNLVTNAGVIGSDVTAVGTARYALAACEYGDDKGIFGYGHDGSLTAVTNLVSNAGVVATDVTGVGSARQLPAACKYGNDKGIFGFGLAGGGNTAITNLVSNAGVVGTDVTGVGTVRHGLVATQYDIDKGIFGFGQGPVGMTNLVSNAGVVATDVTAVGTARDGPGACSFN